VSSERPTLAELIRAAIETRLADTHTALVGEVQAFDAAAQTVDVQPVVSSVLVDRDGNRLVESLPLLTSVPVAFPRAGGYFISMPVAKGDTVLLVCADTSIAKWRETGRVSTPTKTEPPAEERSHDLSDAIAIPGVFASTSALADVSSDSMIFGKDGGLQIKIDDDADLIHLGDPTSTDFLAKYTELRSKLGILQSAYDLHTHLSSSPGNPSSAPTPLLTGAWPGSAFSTAKVKGE
jgi:hypothetical protein